MRLVDVHAHMDYPAFEKDIDAVIQRAKEAGVRAVITNGITPETNRKSLELAKRFDIVYAALGIYPPDQLQWEAETYSIDLRLGAFNIDDEIAFIRENAEKTAGIGEVGLDYSRKDMGLDDKKKQQELFLRTIGLAEELNKPLIVHSRKAEEDVITMLETTTHKQVIMHCFGGKKKLVRRIADNGWYLSIPGSVVRSSHFQSIVEEVAMEQLLTETDAPYLSPNREERNEPAFIPQTVAAIARIKKMEEEAVAERIYANCTALFGKLLLGKL